VPRLLAAGTLSEPGYLFDCAQMPIECYNCKGPHTFANCTEKLNKGNWAAVVANRPYVGNFAPADEQQFSDLRKRVRESMARKNYRRGVERPPAFP
jgi:hypothetical protein